MTDTVELSSSDAAESKAAKAEPAFPETGKLETGELETGTPDTGRREDAQPKETSLAAGAATARFGGLNTIRSLALLVILLYHLHPSFLPGGYLGVDIFLVLSGFLISFSLIQQWQAEAKLDLADFWLKGARRLFPGLTLMILVVVPIAALVQRDFMVGIRRQLLGVFTFTYNWVEIAAESSYFDTTSPQLLAHLWFLSLIVQFSLLWPLLFFALNWGVKNWSAKIGIIAGFAVLSAASMAYLYQPGLDATRVYYGLDTHSFSLLIGVLLALLCGTQNGQPLSRLRTLGSTSFMLAVGSIGAIASFVFLSEKLSFTYWGGMLLFALCIGLLILGTLLVPEGAQNYLDNPVTNWLGERAYGIYLWHWPLLLITEEIWPVNDGSWKYWVERLVIVGLTLSLAELSYRWVETPMRQQGIGQISKQLREATALYRRPVTVTVSVLAIATLAAAMLAPPASLVTRTVEGLNEDTRLTIVTEATTLSSQLDAAQRVHEVNAEALSVEEKEEIAQQYATKKLPSPVKPSGDELTIIGDSIVLTAREEIAKQYPGVSLNAGPSKGWSNALEMIKQAEGEQQLRRSVVIALGTRGGLKDPALLDEVLAALGPTRQVVLVNIHSPANFVDETNRYLSDTAQKYANVIVADWARVAKEHPEFIQTDRINPSSPGETAVVEVIETALKQLSKEIHSHYDSK
ncbi:acyltransferase family protein [Boudabousia marimammalium]|uniref:Acyltransferase 3 domain-containing protein n=1 Tax=Boudabousia marimammalium TaxID=156892 RepID=A0A1Q5PRZ3_9ACTO|nr:acyltransferase family protein [Boudabousia marimammalium]OKL50354.1 hypothetical protein BM477_02945 [Boudabousia marimammalium]